MIYLYRTLWLVFYIPILIIGFLMFVLSIPLFGIACAIWFVKTGDVEDAPDDLIPFKLTVMFFNWYNELLEKIEGNHTKKLWQ